MTHAAFAVSQPGHLAVDYQPGVCNIGPAEIARRRRAGHVGLVATIALFAILVLVSAPPLARLIDHPGAVRRLGPSGVPEVLRGLRVARHLQLRQVGMTEQVATPCAPRQAKAIRIRLASFAIGIGSRSWRSCSRLTPGSSASARHGTARRRGRSRMAERPPASGAGAGDLVELQLEVDDPQELGARCNGCRPHVGVDTSKTFASSIRTVPVLCGPVFQLRDRARRR